MEIHRLHWLSTNPFERTRRRDQLPAYENCSGFTGIRTIAKTLANSKRIANIQRGSACRSKKIPSGELSSALSNLHLSDLQIHSNLWVRDSMASCTEDLAWRTVVMPRSSGLGLPIKRQTSTWYNSILRKLLIVFLIFGRSESKLESNTPSA